MYTSVASGQIKVVVDAVDKKDTFQNDLDSTLTVFDWCELRIPSSATSACSGVLCEPSTSARRDEKRSSAATS
jgi:hypothetical protein